MKIGIITYHRAYNCGAMLQAWALRKVLQDMGHVVSFPSCIHVGEAPRWHPWVKWSRNPITVLKSIRFLFMYNIMSIGAEDVAQRRYNAFRRKYFKEEDLTPETLHTVYDLLVFGSDQIWRAELQSEADRKLFFLQSVDPRIPKITYAASYDDKPLDSPYDRLLADAVMKLRSVSVREQLVADQIHDLTGLSPKIVVDPTLLLTAKDYECLDCGCQPKDDYLFVYTLELEPFIVEAAKEMAKRLGVKLVLTPVYKYSRYGAPKGLIYGTSPERLVTFIRHARYVMSYSFHGTVFSVLFGKQFLDLRPTVDKYETRSGAILKRIGLGDRMANPTNSMAEIEEKLMMPFDNTAFARLAALSADSLSWLKEAIAQ